MRLSREAGHLPRFGAHGAGHARQLILSFKSTEAGRNPHPPGHTVDTSEPQHSVHRWRVC